MSFAKVCATRDKSLRSSSQPQYVRSTRTTLKGLRMLSSPTSSSVTSEGTVLHPPIALPPLFSLPLFHSNGLFDQTPIRCDGAHIGQTFSARGSDFPSRVCVPTCLAIRPVGGRLSSLPPSSFLPAALRSRHRCRRQHHASQPGQLPHAQGGFTLRGRGH